MKRLIVLFFFIASVAFGQTNLPIGTVRKPIMTDANGSVVSTNIVFSNQVVMVPVPSLSNHVARLMDITNFFGTNAVVNLAITNIVNTGSGTGLVSSVSSRVAKIASILPGNGITITNSGNTNITIYATSIASPFTLTNGFSQTPWLGTTNANGVFYLITNSTKIAINSFTDNNAAGLTNFPPTVVGAAAQTNAPNYFIGPFTNTFAGAIIITNNFDSVNRVLISSNNSLTNDYQNGVLFGPLGVTSLNWNGRTASDNTGVTVLDYQNGILYDTTGHSTLQWLGANPRTLRNQNGASAKTVLDWGNYLTLDSSTVNSENWDLRQLLGKNGTTPVLQWGAKQLENTWTNRGTFVVATNIDVAGQIGVGPGGLTSPIAQVHGVFTNQVPDGVLFLADVYGITNTPSFIGRRARGTIASPSAIQADDVMAAFNARGFGATVYSTNSKASMILRASENWSDTAQGTYIALSTTSNQTTTLLEALRIDNAGNLGLGTTAPTEKLHLVGNAIMNGSVLELGAVTNRSVLVVTNSINSNSRILIDSAGNQTVDYQNKLLQQSGNNSINWNSRQEFDALGNVSHDYGARSLRDDRNNITMDYNRHILADAVSGNNIWNFSNQVFFVSQTFNSNIVVQGSVIVTNSMSCSNLVTYTTDGTSYLNSGTNNLMRIIANGSGGTIQTEGLFASRTNTLTAALPVHNAIYTNNNLQLSFTASMLLQSGTGVAFWTVSSGQTNWFDRKISTAITTNSVSGWAQPNALYMVTNFTGGAPTLIPGELNEVRH